MRAISLVDGKVYDANEVKADSAIKGGAWQCASKGCTVLFKGHRRPTYAFDEPDRILRSGTFVHGEDRDHHLDCPLNVVAYQQRLLDKHTEVLTQKGDTLLLHWGEPPQLDRKSGIPTPRQRPQTRRTEYAAVLDAAKDFAQFIDDSDYDDRALRAHFIVHQGVRYTWPEVCYGPSAKDLARLGPSIDQVLLEQSRVWPRLIRAMVADPAAPTASKKRVFVKLRAINKLEDGRYVRARLFAHEDSEAAALLKALQPRDFVYVLADDWVSQPSYGPSVHVKCPEQISIISRSS